MKISVITATYNCRETLAHALESVLTQTYGNIELVVIDGGSTDGTMEILRRYSNRIAVLVSEPDDGIYDALNKGVRHCSGDVVGFLHADDLLSGPDVLNRVASAFSRQSVGCAYGDLQYVCKDNPLEVIRYWRAGVFIQSKLGWGWMPPHPTLYVRRNLYTQLGEFNTSYRIAADYDFILRLFSVVDLNPIYIPEVLVKMRVGGASNRSLKNIMLKSYEDWLALRANRVGGLGALIWKNVSKAGQFLK